MAVNNLRGSVVRSFTLVLFFFMSISSFASEGEKYNLDNSDVVPSSKVVKAGDVFQIALPANITTGYSWVIRTFPAQVALTGMEYVLNPECEKGAVGCKGVTILYFKAVSPGKGPLGLQYVRTWESIPEDIKTIEIIVTQ